MSYILSKPPALDPGQPEVPKASEDQRVHRMSLAVAIITLGVGIASVVIAYLAWTRPFAPLPPPGSLSGPEIPVHLPGPDEVSHPNSVPPPPPPAVPVLNEGTKVSIVDGQEAPRPPGPPETAKVSMEPPDRIASSAPLPRDISSDPRPVEGPEEAATAAPAEPFDPQIEAEAPPSPGEEAPPMTMGEQIDVVAKLYYTPKGARSRSELRYPLVPSDALRSLLSDKLIVCRVSVEADGSAVADCSESPSAIPGFLLQRAKEILEKALWEPATNELGEPCLDEVPVEFRFRELRKK